MKHCQVVAQKDAIVCQGLGEIEAVVLWGNGGCIVGDEAIVLQGLKDAWLMMKLLYMRHNAPPPVVLVQYWHWSQ